MGDRICSLLGCYAPYGGNSLATLRGSLKMGPICRAETPVRAQISYTSRRKLGISCVVLVYLSIYLPDDGHSEAETYRRDFSGIWLYIINCDVWWIRHCIIFRCTVLIRSASQKKVEAGYCQTWRRHIYIIVILIDKLWVHQILDYDPFSNVFLYVTHTSKH